MSLPVKATGIHLRIERTKHHFEELKVIVGEFQVSEPYTIGAKHHPDTRKLIYYVSGVAPMPPLVPVLVGEVLHGFRTSLDHMAYQLVVAAGGTPSKQSAFPVFKDAAEYKAQSPGKVKGMRKDMIDAINALELYKGGKGHQFWVLHELNNIDKHRLLLTAGSAFRSMDLGYIASRALREAFPDKDFGPPISAFFKPADRMCPLKAGDELYIGAPDEKPDENLKFAFDIALAEPQITESESLTETLHQLGQLVVATLAELDKLL